MWVGVVPDPMIASAGRLREGFHSSAAGECPGPDHAEEALGRDGSYAVADGRRGMGIADRPTHTAMAHGCAPYATEG